jgi:small subunit ribosomal protein S18
MTYQQKRRVCKFCADNTIQIDYKNVDMIRHYISNFGKIVSKSRTGVCAKHQRLLARSIKRSRFMSLLP